MISTQVSIPGYAVSKQLYDGSRTLVYRAVRETDNKPVVIKLLKNSYPGFGELVQFRNQYTIAKNLNNPGIIQTYSLEPFQNGYILVMEDFGGISLNDYFVKNSVFSVSEFLQVAIALCNTLNILYQNRIIHKDIKPSNILINPKTKQVKLIDFSIASLLPRETQTLVNPNVLEGTLAYISPEQTGRMNRGIDYRTDFYSLGVTFYELLTGELPFASNDPMELLHCHIAKAPRLIHEINPQIPAVLSEIVSKLMAKNAEDRYQSALGLRFDLEKCLYQLQETGEIQDFEIAEKDVCDRFVIPEKLYGREQEVSSLLTAFDRVNKETSELILVGGFSGIGKTAVVNEVHKPIVQQRGYFIKGKFDQFNRNSPLSAFVQAFRDLMGQLLSESDIQLQAWKTRLLQALGENGQVIIDVIPELERIIGKQPQSLELFGNAAQNRFNLLFQKFIQVFTQPKHPLVMFLDDLQWADSASLNLMQRLIAESKPGYLLLIGAYRDNEVFPTHPLMLTLDKVVNKGATVNTITLQPLSQTSLNQLISDTLNCQPALAQPLTKLVYQKTQGNPFFATQFLKTLHQDELIIFDCEARHWQCDVVRVQEAALTEDVVELMALQLQKLPPITQDILKLAACIGSQFDLNTLAIASGLSHGETAAALWKALQEELILPIGEKYKFYVGQASEDEGQNAEIVSYKFLHDRVQQAAYSLIPDVEKQATHYQIGQLLLKHITPESREEWIFEIVNQLNCGVSLITNQSDRDQLAQLNFAAGRKARTATAYRSASEYAEMGLSLLGDAAWQRQYEITLLLHNLAAEVSSLGGDFDRMNQYIDAVISHASTPLEQLSVYIVKIQALASQNQLLAAISSGQAILQALGVEFLDTPNTQYIQQAIQKINDVIGDRAIEELFYLPAMVDPEKLGIIQIAANIMPVCYMANSPLFPLLILLSVNLSLQYGNSPSSAISYAAYGNLLIKFVQDVTTADQFGRLAYQLAWEPKAKDIRAATFSPIGLFLYHRKSHLRETLPIFQAGFEVGLETGKLDRAGNNAHQFCLYSYLSGQSLTELEPQIRNYRQQLLDLNQIVAANYCSIYWQIALSLMGETGQQQRFWENNPDVEQLVTQALASKDLVRVFFFYLLRMKLRLLFGYITLADADALQARQYMVAGAGTICEANFYFHDSLIVLAQISEPQLTEIQWQRIAENQAKLQHWAEYAPMNHLHKWQLVEAEKARRLGQTWQATEYYDRAISGAKYNDYTHDEALANELTAKFYLEWHKDRIAQEYLIAAYYGYARWGAKAKVADLEHHYPQLLKPILEQRKINLNPLETIATISRPCASQATHTSTSDSTSISDALDLTSTLKAAQAISSSLKLDTLITNLTQIIVENSGAKRAVLLLFEEDTWQVRATTLIENQEIKTVLEPKSLENYPDVPTKIINYVKNTQQTVVIDNCQTDIPGLIGQYMLSHQPQSVLCTPIINQGHLVGIIYLENELISGVFTNQRLQVINLLCTQAAISLENSQLYTNLQASEARFLRLAENVPGMIYQFQLSVDGIASFNYVSSGCYGIYEVLPEEAVADANNLISLMHPEEISYFYESVAISAQTLQPWQYQGRIITPSGKLKWIQAVSRPVKQEDGKIIWDGLLLDITERKQAEAVVGQKSQELEKALQDLQQAQLQIIQSEKMSALGNLVAGVAHEMNNPLGFIAASLKQAQPTIADLSEHMKLYQEALPNPGDEIQEHAEEIDLDYSLNDLPKMMNAMVMACDRLKNISTSLRTFSRADRDYKVPFNIHEGIDSTILILKHRLKANEQRPAIEVITSYGNLPQVQCFPGQLNQVFMNILANAIDALEDSKNGHSFEDIVANPNMIAVKTCVEDNYVKISIADNANGMSEEVKQKIFDHLFTTKGVGKGTGLGLAIARQIIEETHNGKLICHSGIGKGTEFVIQLPL
ncbi:two-component hybrid sensor and regulator [Calothrix sp. NIES-4101]|nr:two-component hybrid sensor and regulator [Calothrix sp. NIES-4101]